MEDIILSYETLFEILRLERSRNELQTLPNTYYDDIQKIIEDLKFEASNGLDKSKEIQLKNTLKIINEIYERRERKIINMALDKSKTKNALIDFSKFLDKEKQLFLESLNLFDNYRFRAKLIDQDTALLKQDDKKNYSEDEAKPEINGSEKTVNDSVKAISSDIKIDEETNELKLVRFLYDFPSFVGPDGAKLGPFDKEDIANLPYLSAEILIKKERVQEVQPI